jgi:DNA-binding transcriptional regulator YdaS (Cro superfamily)
MSKVKTKTNQHLYRAIQIAGSQEALAAHIKRISKNPKMHQSHISYWTRSVHGTPPQYCQAIETATHGRVTRQQLRPDIFGDKA